MAVDQSSNWDDGGIGPPAGEAKYVVSEQPIAEYDNYFNYSVAKDIENIIAEFADYFKKDGTVEMTGYLKLGLYGVRGSSFSPHVAINNSVISLIGNTVNDGGKSARINIYGYDHSSYPGQIIFWLPNAAKTTTLHAGHFQGNTDTPKLQLTHGLITNLIKEKTGAAGVTIDSCLIKDGKVADSENLDGLGSLDFIKKDGTVAMTGILDAVAAGIKTNTIYNNNQDNDVAIYGTTSTHASKSTNIRVFGYDDGTYPAWLMVYITNATKSSNVLAGYFEGVTDTPKFKLLHGLICGSIEERTTDVGVTIDSCLIKDGYPHIPNHTPSAANDTGTAGQICYDANYIYMCVATDTWKRVAIATW